MKKPSYILITMDEVRSDHLPCYGYRQNKMPNLDKIVHEGVTFDETISTSCFTPVSHGTILTGLYPQKHGIRNPFNRLEAKSISEYMKERDYQTAGFVGVNLIGRACGFESGFDYFDEPQNMNAWRATSNEDGSRVLWGNDWTEKMFEWIQEKSKNPFFIWAHYFDCHEGAEKPLLEQGKIEKGVLEESSYYDAKIQFMDTFLFGRLIEILKKCQIEKTTYVIITSDHGTNLGEHPLPCNKKLGITYPQHLTLYDCDLKVPLILKGPGIPKDRRVSGMVRSVDITPTILDLCELVSEGLDGTSLLPFIEESKSEGLTVYAEELFHSRGPGDYQAIRSQKYKLILDRRSGKEEFYNLEDDPGERNCVCKLSSQEKRVVREWREICDRLLSFTNKNLCYRDRKMIEEKLKDLGYME